MFIKSENTRKYVGEENKKEFAANLKKIYHAPSEEAAQKQLKAIAEKWEKEYPNAMKSWNSNWDVISPIFKFSAQIRKVIFTTNVIESLNSYYRRLNKQRSVFPSDKALLKALYHSTNEIAKKWTILFRNWGRALGELEIMYPNRFLSRRKSELICAEPRQFAAYIVYCKKNGAAFLQPHKFRFFHS